MDYRREELKVGKYRVKQLTVVGVAAESFWSLAFHERRGLSNLPQNHRPHYLDVAQTWEMHHMSIQVAGRISLSEFPKRAPNPPPPCEINLGSFALGCSSCLGAFDVRRLQ